MSVAVSLQGDPDNLHRNNGELIGIALSFRECMQVDNLVLKLLTGPHNVGLRRPVCYQMITMRCRLHRA